MRVLIPVFIVAVLALAAVAIVAIRSRTERARHARRELARHEEFLNRLRREALASAAIDPTSAVIADEIGNHLAALKETR